jgi:cytochrome P450
LDLVVGPSRLPLLSDEDDLAYVQAYLEEALRWRPVTAGEMLHLVTQDDEYLGYRFSARSIVIAKYWSIVSDPSVFTSPDKFYPKDGLI